MRAFVTVNKRFRFSSPNVTSIISAIAAGLTSDELDNEHQQYSREHEAERREIEWPEADVLQSCAFDFHFFSIGEAAHFHGKRDLLASSQCPETEGQGSQRNHAKALIAPGTQGISNNRHLFVQQRKKPQCESDQK